VYDDEYPSCRSTYATLRILCPGDAAPETVTQRLGVEPTRTQRRGEKIDKTVGGISQAGWFLSSQGKIKSRDVRRHIDSLLDQVAPNASVLVALQSEGYTADVFCYWLSESGHGGPTLSPEQSRRLAACDLDVGFDIYVAPASSAG
jgi:Domain of unknown function (DUF4279)